MSKSAEPMLAIVMGIIILIADIYWIYTSGGYTLWIALGVIIFIATLVWLYLDWDMSRKH
jgi:hypothetical protein